MSLGLTHLAGFGVPQGPDIIVASAFYSQAQDGVFYTERFDFGPPGKKQIFAVISSWDNDVSDNHGYLLYETSVNLVVGEARQGAWDTAMTEVIKDTELGGTDLTLGAGIYSLETHKSGLGQIWGVDNNFTGVMDRFVLGVVVVKGYDLTPVATKSEKAGSGTFGNNISINTSGASLVMVGGVDRGDDPGAMTGPGAVTVEDWNTVSVGYGVPTTTPSVYTFTGDTDLIVAASFKKL